MVGKAKRLMEKKKLMLIREHKHDLQYSTSKLFMSSSRPSGVFFLQMDPCLVHVYEYTGQFSTHVHTCAECGKGEKEEKVSLECKQCRFQTVSKGFIMHSMYLWDLRDRQDVLWVILNVNLTYFVSKNTPRKCRLRLRHCMLHPTSSSFSAEPELRFTSPCEALQRAPIQVSLHRGHSLCCLSQPGLACPFICKSYHKLVRQVRVTIHALTWCFDCLNAVECYWSAGSQTKEGYELWLWSVNKANHFITLPALKLSLSGFSKPQLTWNSPRSYVSHSPPALSPCWALSPWCDTYISQSTI